LLDPADPLDAEIIGIRWAPIFDTYSRFGLDPQDTEVVQEAAEVIASLPRGAYRLGMHFHHASSALGGRRWFALASAFAVFCGEFSALCGRPLACVDFGGGFEPHFLESEFAADKLTALFTTVHEHCNKHTTATTTTTDADHALPHPPVCVQFELGKSVSEDAGGVLTRILAIRERRDTTKTKSRKIAQATADREKTARKKGDIQAVIVDTTVADISTPNAKPVFLVRLPTVEEAQKGTLPRCVPLPPGDAQIWGRTCMEWDMVRGSFQLPADVKEGDLLFVAGCGAYDMSMQYDFGDGIGRSKNVITL
jgi:diaminopimelate decarboxylase